MKKSEVIEKYEHEIIEEMKDAYRCCLNTDGDCTEQIWIWEDGEIEVLFNVRPNTGVLVPRAGEDRQLFYVLTVDEISSNFSIWDTTCEPEPDDENEAEKMKQELMQDILDEYDPYIQFDEVLAEAKWEENNTEEIQKIFNF